MFPGCLKARALSSKKDKLEDGNTSDESKMQGLLTTIVAELASLKTTIATREDLASIKLDVT